MSYDYSIVKTGNKVDISINTDKKFDPACKLCTYGVVCPGCTGGQIQAYGFFDSCGNEIPCPACYGSEITGIVSQIHKRHKNNVDIDINWVVKFTPNLSLQHK